MWVVVKCQLNKVQSTKSDVPEGLGKSDCKDLTGERESEPPETPAVAPVRARAPSVSLPQLVWGGKLYWSSVGTDGWLNRDSAGPAALWG